MTVRPLHWEEMQPESRHHSIVERMSETLSVLHVQGPRERLLFWWIPSLRPQTIQSSGKRVDLILKLLNLRF